jgi:hypothetical protein
MPKKRHTAEQIIPKLREAEVLLAQGSGGGLVVERSTFRPEPEHRPRVPRG